MMDDGWRICLCVCIFFFVALSILNDACHSQNTIVKPLIVQKKMAFWSHGDSVTQKTNDERNFDACELAWKKNRSTSLAILHEFRKYNNGDQANDQMVGMKSKAINIY